MQNEPDEIALIFSVEDISPGVTHTYDPVTKVLTVDTGDVGGALTIIAEV